MFLMSLHLLQILLHHCHCNYHCYISNCYHKLTQKETTIVRKRSFVYSLNMNGWDIKKKKNIKEKKEFDLSAERKNQNEKNECGKE